MLAIYKRELRGYFVGVIGYVFLVIYLAMAGILFSYTTMFSMSANVTSYFTLMLIFSAIVLPLLTMKSFSEERKTKTEQLILTAPISLPAMVFGKFLASYTVFGSATLLTSLYFLFLVPYAKLQFAILFGNLVALMLVGMVFISIGLFVSALTENQLSAAIGTIAIILGFLGIGLINTLIPTKYAIRFVFSALSIFTRFQSYVNGYFEIASVIYYLSVSAIFLWLTIRVYDRRRFG
ncbi:MAG: ABC transporter permease [Clostridia bacterium]|jgi:ABC-2 type transport system permease protein|nr:ABC transporter permease [Clostridia bacterium]